MINEISERSYIMNKKRNLPIFSSQKRSTEYNALRRHNISFNAANLSVKEELKLMLYKHFIIYSRNLKSILFVFLTPIFFLYLLQSMQWLTDNYKDKSITHEFPVNNITRAPLDCRITINSSVPCVSLGVAVLGPEDLYQKADVDFIIRAIENQTELSTRDGGIEVLNNFKDQDELYQLFDDKTKMYQYILSICYGNFKIGNQVVPCKPEITKDKEFHLYTLIYNISNTPNAFLDGHNSPYPIDKSLVRMKQVIDNAYLALFHKKNQTEPGSAFPPKIETIETQAYPAPASRLTSGANVISTFGSFYLFFPPMILFSIILLDIVKEKETGLKQYVILNGMSLISYWIAWCIVSVIFSLLLTGEILFIGYFILRFDIFTNVNIVISFLLFFLFSLSLQFLSMMLSNYVSSLSGATTMSYSVIVIGIVIQTILTNYTIMYFLYATNVDFLWLKLLLKGLSLFMHFYPPFIFTKCFVDIVSISSSHFDYDMFQWLPGRYYSFRDMFTDYKGKLLIGIEYRIDSMFETSIWFFVSILLYSVVISFKEIRDYYGKMYKKTEFSLSDKKKSYYDGEEYYDYYEILVDLMKKYFPQWVSRYNPFVYLKNFYDTNFNFNKSNKRRNEIENSVVFNFPEVNNSKVSKEINSENSSLIFSEKADHSVLNEKKKIANLHKKRQPPNGIRILTLCRSFKNNSGEKIEAVKDINVDINKGESFGLLGPNGAGKTTLINLLSCQLRAGNGYAKIGPFIIHSEMFIDSLYIKRMIGVCGQFDQFWEEMTVLETITFFGRLKGIKTQHSLLDKIGSFGLNGKENERVCSLSGGMRRRVSLLLATLGDPYILYLDEPTTGLDPVNRRKIWHIISELKQNRVILLSTQNIEEVDYLTDRLGVMVDGSLMYIGTTSEIMKMSSYGFELSICIDIAKMTQEDKSFVDNYIKSSFTGSYVTYTSSGVYRIQIAHGNKEEILKAMQIIDRNGVDEEMKKMMKFIKDTVVTQANLEKCFIDLCHKFK